MIADTRDELVVVVVVGGGGDRALYFQPNLTFFLCYIQKGAPY